MDTLHFQFYAELNESLSALLLLELTMSQREIGT